MFDNYMALCWKQDCRPKLRFDFACTGRGEEYRRAKGLMELLETCYERFKMD